MKRFLTSAFGLSFLILSVCIYFVSTALKDKNHYYQHSTLEFKSAPQGERIHLISRLDDYHNCMVGAYGKQFFPDAAIVASECYGGDQAVSPSLNVTYSEIYKGRFESKGSSSPYVVFRDKSGLDAVVYSDSQSSAYLMQLTNEIKQRPSVLEATFVSK